MAATKTVIANLALLNLGHSTEIGDLDTERSEPARVMRRIYSEVLKEVLEDFPWPFATKSVALTLFEEDPDDEWLYSYTYPSDCVRFNRIQSGNRVDTEGTRVKFRIFDATSGKRIYTDQEDAIGEYIVLKTDPTHYPAKFVAALAAKLAERAAPAICGEDPFKMGDKSAFKYKELIGEMQANAANEESPDLKPDPESTRARS